MGRYFVLLFCISSLSIFNSCGRNLTSNSDSLIINCWTDSHEEATHDGSDIYRPCDFKAFPPSRYRNAFTLKEDGTCNYLVLAPDDAHHFLDGKWELSNLILELKVDKLLMKKI